MNNEKIPAKILIIEDDVWLSRSFEKVLKRKFTDVKSIQDPAEAFDVFAEFWPDMIIADVLLGEQNLFVLLNEMQSYDDSRKIPIIILSSLAEKIRAENVAEFGVKEILDKAEITPETLRKSAQNILENLKNGAENEQ